MLWIDLRVILHAHFVVVYHARRRLTLMMSDILGRLLIVLLLLLLLKMRVVIRASWRVTRSYIRTWQDDGGVWRINLTIVTIYFLIVSIRYDGHVDATCRICFEQNWRRRRAAACRTATTISLTVSLFVLFKKKIIDYKM